jgi:hypothetical protein
MAVISNPKERADSDVELESAGELEAGPEYSSARIAVTNLGRPSAGELLA